MPLVFAMNDASESEHSYADRAFEQYEFPMRYRRIISEGEPFVYYRGGRRPDGPRETPVYFGTGTVGPIYPSTEEGRLTCSVANGRPFRVPVPFKSGELHLEPGGHRRGYYQPGVRRISDDTYDHIMQIARDLDATP